MYCILLCKERVLFISSALANCTYINNHFIFHCFYSFIFEQPSDLDVSTQLGSSSSSLLLQSTLYNIHLLNTTSDCLAFFFKARDFKCMLIKQTKNNCHIQRHHYTNHLNLTSQFTGFFLLHRLFCFKTLK